MKYFLCLVFVVSLCCALAYDIDYATKPSLDVSCSISNSKTYSRIGQKHYFLGHEKVNWFEAAHLCRRYGGDLAQIDSAEEMNAISSHLQHQGFKDNDYFWISGNDLVINHMFLSISSGFPLTFTSWSAGQPDFPGAEHCVHLWHRDGAFRMNNWSCTEKAFYICQREYSSRCQVNL
ncbi:C-type lectin 37Db-like [Drosophila innubila]|uniref:C-type lectin 37Db-like n=1 Tax=Drosophila innubila TaxID=198719 RepID=UPI00148C07FB|nr:C-type lectin 37Db-like [Drosophila innubila]